MFGKFVLPCLVLTYAVLYFIPASALVCNKMTLRNVKIFINIGIVLSNDFQIKRMKD